MSSAPEQLDSADVPQAGWRRLMSWPRRRWKTALLVAAGLLGSAAAASLFLLRLPPENGSRAEVTLEQALDSFAAGNYDEARKLAMLLRQDGTLGYHGLGGPMYLLGASIAAEAEEFSEPQHRERLFLVASRYLEEAHIRGFPAGHERTGRLLLARMYLESHQPNKALKPLLEILPQADSLPDVHRLLARAYDRERPPRYELALDHLERLLPTVAARERPAILLWKARLLLDLKQDTRVEETMAEIPRDTPHGQAARLLRVRLWLRRLESVASEERPALAERCLRELRAIPASAQASDETKRGAHYCLGLTYRGLGDLETATAKFSSTHRVHYGSSESVAAALNEAELHLSAGNAPLAQASLTRILEDSETRDLESNRWIAYEDLQARCRALANGLLAAREYQLAIDLATPLGRVLPEETVAELTARVDHRWGEALHESAAALPFREAEMQRSKARERFRQAGHAYAHLAALRYASPVYAETLWQSVTCYLEGQNFSTALEIVELYRAHCPPRAISRGLMAAGRCHLALGQPAEALVPLRQCLEDFPKDPAIFATRLLAAQACLEIEQVAEATSLLEENLYGGELTPRSLEWNKSLFELGQIHYLHGKRLEAESRNQKVDSSEPSLRKQGLQHLAAAVRSFDRAIRMLDEVVQRRPQEPPAMSARYMIAEAHREAAKLPKKQLAIETIDASRARLNEQVSERLNLALAAHRQLIELLNERDQSTLSPLEQRILRNSYFALADAWFDLGAYEKAIEAYSESASRYQSEPAALEAFVQIASCYRRLNRPADARGTLERARVVLDHLPADADFAATTRHDREQWSQLLQWLASL